MKRHRKTIFHIDVNSAYLSWEAAYRLEQGEEVDLRKIPSAIGGDEASRHGVVLARSTPAKKYGVVTGEPLAMARRKCAHLIVVPARHEIYEQYSNALIELLKDYSPCVEPFSIDESFIDYTNMEMHFGPPVKAANDIKERIKKELGFTVNIGISTNKLLAKMAGELKKPDLVHTLYPEEIQEKIWHLPVRELYMVGKVTADQLISRGITTIGRLASTDLSLLQQWFGQRGEMIWNYANGIESSPVQGDGETCAKGISNATTVAHDIVDNQEAYKVLLGLVENVATRLRQSSVKAQILSVSLRNNDFRTYSRQRKLMIGTSCTTEIYQIVCQLFDEAWKGEPLRQLGVSATELQGKEQGQLTLMDHTMEKQAKLDAAIDDIRNKYGKEAIIRSALLKK